jgi:hypothetical protein
MLFIKIGQNGKERDKLQLFFFFPNFPCLKKLHFPPVRA